MSWTQDRVALLEKLWKEGKTAKEIAETLGGVTRNAVIGKAHRLSLSGRQASANASGATTTSVSTGAKPVKATKSEPSAKAEQKKIESARVRIVAQSQEKLKNKSAQMAAQENAISSAKSPSTQKASTTKSQPKLRSIAPAVLPQDLAPKNKAANKNSKMLSAPPKGGVQLQDLKDRMCKWPYGDPKEADFHFCGGRAVNGLPYCDHHAHMAYQPNKKSAILNPESFENARPRNEDDDEDGQIITM